MEYDDFRLSSDNEMRLMSEAYNSVHTFDRRTSLYSISSLISACLSNCYGVTNRISNKLRTKIEKIKNELEKLSENLSITFSYQNELKIEKITNFNLFLLLKSLINIIEELHIFENNEDKVYYKNFLKKTIDLFLSLLFDTFDTLENSNIHLFKYI